MTESRNVLVGILAVILGLMVIIFPLIGVSTLSDLAGIGIIFLGIWLLVQSFKAWEKSVAAAVADLILAVLAILWGVVFIGNIKAFAFLTFLALYIVGFFIIISGLTALFSDKSLKGKAIGALGLLLGVLFLIFSVYLKNPLVLAATIGAFLIIAGIVEIFDLLGEKPVPEITK